MSQRTGFDTNKEKNYEQLFRKTTTATMLADVCADGCGCQHPKRRQGGRTECEESADGLAKGRSNGCAWWWFCATEYLRAWKRHRRLWRQCAPLEITLRDGKVENIRALTNSETPDFFRLASALLTKWNGQTIEDAQKIGVDSAGRHAGHGIRLSAFWQEIILLHACVSLRFFAGTCREVRRI